MVKLADVLLVAAAPSLDLSAIPQTFTHLQLVLSLRGDGAGVTQGVSLRFNNDATAGAYQSELVSAAAAVVAAAEAINTNLITLGACPAATGIANHFSSHTVGITNYRSAAAKVAEITAATRQSTASGGLLRYLIGGFWASAAAINRVTVFPAAGNFVSGSRATLYGLP